MTVTSKEMTAIKVKLLKEMHNYIIEMGDEDIYETWIAICVPDEPTEDDFEYIAENDEEWVYVCKEFGKLVEIDLKENY